MLTWLRSLNRQERLTLLACFLGWALDAMDTQSANLLNPTLARIFALNEAQIGMMATAALIASGIGGWLAGAASDRFGRVVVLQVTILWFSLGSLLCGLAQTYPQLVAARIFQGMGFGGEWAVGAVLIAEITRPQYRATAVGIVQSGYSFGVAAAAGLYFTAYSLLPEELAWRALFFAGIAPALLVLLIRRVVSEPTRFNAARRADAAKDRLWHIFHAIHRRATMLGSLLCLTLQGATATLSVWLPTLLRVSHGLSVGLVGLFLTLQSIGAFAGYLTAAVIADRLGRRVSLAVFTMGAMAASAMLCLMPMTPMVTLSVALPFGFFVFGLFSNFGPVLSELYPAAVRGSGQGFCYNFGRGVGAIFPAIVGVGAASLTLPVTMGMMALSAYALACIVILFLPETRGKVIDGGVAEDAALAPSAQTQNIFQH